MSDRFSATHILWVFAATAGLARATLAIEPAAVSAPSAGSCLSMYEPGTTPAEPAPDATPDASLARALWLPSTPADPAAERSLVTPGVLDATERKTLAEEFRPTLAAPPDPKEDSGVPNHPALTDRFFFGVGAFYANANTEGRLNNSAGVGTTVDMEDVMGLDSSDIVPQGLMRWRFSERWRLEAEYFALNRSNTKKITGEIVWGDQTFPVDTMVDAKFNISVMRVSCGYSFFKRQDKEIGVALGFHVTDIEAKLSSGGSSEDEGKLLAPLPVGSLYGQFALTDLWAVSGRMDVFRLEYGPYSGHVFSLGLDALCQPWRNFGFGLGWRSLDIKASVDSGDWNGDISTSYQGPIVFASLSF